MTLLALISLVAAVLAVALSAADNGRPESCMRQKLIVTVLSLLLLIHAIIYLGMDLSIMSTSNGS